MIVHHAETRSFFLQGPTSSYVLGVDAHDRLLHIHWGARVEPGALGSVVHVLDRAFSPNPNGGRSYSLDNLPQECPTAGASDFRSAAVAVEHPDGSALLDLFYHSHAITAGKPRLPGLPATYVEADAEATTLVITLIDKPSGVRVELLYTQFAGFDAIARSMRIINASDAPRHVVRAFSASLDLPHADHHLVTLPGAWGRERNAQRAPLRAGLQAMESRRGTSSHQANPFIALLDPTTTEEHGEARGVSLVYSGCFTALVEVDQFSTARVQAGLNPPGFRWRLAPGETFHAPEAVLVFSGTGLGAMSRTYHRLYRTRLARGAYRDAPRPILINNWEATYFDFDTDKLISIARKAREIGVELMVLDDGWFGARAHDAAGLGDWVVNEKRLPGGLTRLASEIEALGMRFGLWFEPEMVNPDSDLYRAHPDWCLHVPGRVRSEARSQLVLDLSRPEVREYIYGAVTKVLRNARISYVKWDMNRHLTEVWSPAHPTGEVHHRWALGVYELLERITAEFPHVLFESCSGGGGRFDPGLLHYMPQVWTSDNTDAMARLHIQHGTSLVYPLSAMGAHVSAVPNHQTGRISSMRTRGHVAFTGAFGFELDLNKLPAEELQAARELVQEYERVRALLVGGELHRLIAPNTRDAAWMVVAPDRGIAFATYVQVLGETNATVPVLRMRGLDPRARYRVSTAGETDLVLGGDALMAIGLRPLLIRQDFTSRTWHLERV